MPVKPQPLTAQLPLGADPQSVRQRIEAPEPPEPEDHPPASRLPPPGNHGNRGVKRRDRHSFVIAFGMFLSSILDPRTRVQTEMLDRKDSRDRTEPGRENQ